MATSLQHNITAMKATKQLPSFVQVLVTLEAAQAEIDRLRADSRQLDILTREWNIATKAAREEIVRLQLENDRLWQAIRDGMVVGSIS